MTKPLPPGQKERADFPRFGVGKYAELVPRLPEVFQLEVGGDLVDDQVLGTDDLAALPRVEQVSDFHCVTTWSKIGLRWEGVRFSEFYERLVQPHLAKEPGFVVFRCLDTLVTGLPMEDALAADVLLADTLDGQPLGLLHGAPLRLVAPAHYGFKNPKHIHRLEFWEEAQKLKSGIDALLDHPRGRVALEERGALPGVILRYLYRPVVTSTVRQFDRAFKKWPNGRE